MAQILPPGQFKEFEQHLNQLISSAATGEITHDELEIKVASLLAQYFGAYTGSSFWFSEFYKTIFKILLH